MLVFLTLFLVSGLFNQVNVAAQCSFSNMSGCSKNLIINKNAVCHDTQSCIIWFVNILFLIAVLFSFVFLVWGGLDYIMAGGDTAKAGAARLKLTNAVIGLVVVIVAWAVSTFVFNFFAQNESPLNDIGSIGTQYTLR